MWIELILFIHYFAEAGASVEVKFFPCRTFLQRLIKPPGAPIVNVVCQAPPFGNRQNTALGYQIEKKQDVFYTSSSLNSCDVCLLYIPIPEMVVPKKVAKNPGTNPMK